MATSKTHAFVDFCYSVMLLNIKEQLANKTELLFSTFQFRRRKTQNMESKNTVAGIEGEGAFK